MTTQNQHPEPATLEAFALGRLSLGLMESIEAHLSGCSSCGRRVQDAPDDPFVRLLRRPPSPIAERAAPG